ACDVSDIGSTIDIHGDLQHDNVVVRIRDYGPGISAENHQRVFEPFYTTKAVGQGTGLGLPMVYSLIKEHGGRISIDTSVVNGVCFEVSLPAASSFIDKAG
ncbi:MAG: HAMP domain-containing sensor histidine kinase, partial [Pseudomonadota bacterium]